MASDELTKHNQEQSHSERQPQNQTMLEMDDESKLFNV